MTSTKKKDRIGNSLYGFKYWNGMIMNIFRPDYLWWFECPTHRELLLRKTNDAMRRDPVHVVARLLKCYKSVSIQPLTSLGDVEMVQLDGGQLDGGSIGDIIPVRWFSKNQQLVLHQILDFLSGYSWGTTNDYEMDYSAVNYEIYSLGHLWWNNANFLEELPYAYCSTAHLQDKTIFNISNIKTIERFMKLSGHGLLLYSEEDTALMRLRYPNLAIRVITNVE